jgi:hypothetical protein
VNDFTTFVPLAKIDLVAHEVWGWAAEEAPDVFPARAGVNRVSHALLPAAATCAKRESVLCWQCCRSSDEESGTIHDL